MNAIRSQILNGLCSLGLAAGLIAANAADSKNFPTHAPALIELSDQFNQGQRLCYPTTRITVLTIADKKGAAQIDGWVLPVDKRFGRRVDVRGIADVSAVPWILHSPVRRQVQKTQPYPIMLDWSGEAVKAFATVPEQANVLVLDERGKILTRFAGAADEKSLNALYAALDAALAASAK